MQGGLHGGAADSGLCGERVDRVIAETITLDLKGDDTQDRALAFGVVVPQIVRERAGAAWKRTG